jgi:hypothetical protein
MEEKKNSEVFLRPRFKMEIQEAQEALLKRFRENLSDPDCKYCSKIVDGHVVIDVPEDDNHFWSPQLSLEVVEEGPEKSVVKGLFGPKPQVWTLFMFFHFAVAVAFITFSVMAYVQYSLDRNYTFALTMVFVLPAIWVLMYFIGRLGKRTGKVQMEELHDFMMKTLDRD